MSSKESKRTLVVSERRKVCINFQISTFLGSGITPGFSRASFKESERWFLREVLVVVDKMDIHNMWSNSLVLQSVIRRV